MPAVSAPQQHLFGMALAYKRGDLHGASPEVRRVAGGMSERQLRDFAATRGLASGGNAGGIGHPEAYHLMPAHGIGAAHAVPVMSGSQATPWWSRSSARMEEQPMRHGFAAGGMMAASEASPWWERSEARQFDTKHPGGLIDSSLAGRTDRLPLAVPSESHILPADSVSGAGQGNSLAGARILQQAMRIGPYGVPFPPAMHAHTIPHPPSLPHSETGLAAGGRPKDVSILAAGGEMVVPHDDWVARDQQDGKLYLHRGVRSIGDGDTMKGHQRLDDMIKRVRAHVREFLLHAPPPKT